MNQFCLLNHGSKRTFSLWFTVVLLATFVGLPTESASGESLRRSAIVRAVELARPSVVNITGQKMVPADDQYSDAKKRVNGMGTGVVVDPRGYILTNYHVVEGVRRINVTTYDGQAFVARIVAHDTTTDLAIIKIPTRQAMKVIKFGSSRDIMLAETVIAMGNAYGYENTVTTGIVSALHRNMNVNESQYRDLIQTDASINPGNSGGPLLNIDGQMIGINVAVRVGANGIGFAIPVDHGRAIAARLMSVERLSGLWHGVIYENQTETGGSAVVVRNVQPDSPAARAGIRAGDVIRQVAGRDVDHGLEVECALIGTHVGDSVAFAMLRGDQVVDVNVGLENLPRKTSTRRSTNKPTADSDVAADPAWNRLGLRLQPVDDAEVKRQSEKFRGGLRVVAIDEDGVAAAQGIRNDDILVGVHIWETISLDNLQYVMNDADFKTTSTVPFYIVRNGKTLSGEFDVDVLR